MSYVYQEEQRRAAAAQEARRQAEAAERQRQDAMAWDRQRQLQQEELLRQEQARRLSETQGSLQNQRRSIDSNLELGKYGEDTKRMGQRADLTKSRMANETARYGHDTTRYGFDTMGKMFGDQQGQQTGISLYDNSGTKIGGGSGYSGAGGGYKPQNFSLRSSLLAPGG